MDDLDKMYLTKIIVVIAIAVVAAFLFAGIVNLIAWILSLL